MAWKVKIAVSREGSRTLEEEFEHSPITLGALPDSDLMLDDPFVSGQHAVVKVSRGQMVFRDLSRNGSYIDGQRISEQNLGSEATVDIPPFRLQLVFERDERSRETMFRGDRAAVLEEARRELMREHGWPDGAEVGTEAGTGPPAAATGPPAPSLGPLPPSASPFPPAAEPGPPAAQRPVTPPPVTPASVAPRQADPPPFATTRPISSDTAVGNGAGDSVAEPLPARPAPGPTPAAPEQATVPSIEVVQGLEELQGLVLALGNEMTLGRADTADLWMPADTVSRRHAVIRRRSDGGYRIEDCGSANGTYVNDQKIDAGDLSPGDEIRIGEVSLRFAGGPSAEPPAKPAEPELSAESFPESFAESSAESSAESAKSAKPARSDESPARPTEPPPSPPLAPPPIAEPEPVADIDGLHFERRALSKDGSRVLVTARGRVDGYNYTQLGDSLDSTIDDGGRYLVLDLTEVDYVGHTGLGVLVRCQSRLRRLRGEMRLVGLNERIRDALALTRLDSLFQGKIFPDRAAATRDLA